MALSNEEIQQFADLARLHLDPAEAEDLRADFDAILVYISEINKAKFDTAVSEARLSNVRNVFREDTLPPHEREKYTNDILRLVPNTEKGYVKVRKILS